jgi:hypothetical protein
MARIKLGELLVQARAIDEMQLRAALGEQKKWGKPLGRTLVEMRIIDEKTLVAALSRQLNLPAVDLEVVTIPESVLRHLKADFCVERGCLPFRHVTKGNFLDVAMSDPTDQALFDSIRVLTRCNVRPYLAGPLTLESAIRKYYFGEAPAPRLQDNRPWVGRPEESVFDMSGKLSGQTAESRPAVSTNELALDEMRPAVMPQAVSPAGPSSRERVTAGFQLARLAQEVDRLSAEVADLSALLERDERVIRKLMAIMIEKGLCSKEELVARINRP